MPGKCCSICNRSWKNEKIKMFGVPKKNERRKLWSIACGRTLKNSSRICEMHFGEDDFLEINGISRAQLKMSAVPSKNHELLDKRSSIASTDQFINEELFDESLRAASAMTLESGNESTIDSERTFESATGSNCVSKAVQTGHPDTRMCGFIEMTKEMEMFSLNCFYCTDQFQIWNWTHFVEHIKQKHQGLEQMYINTDSLYVENKHSKEQTAGEEVIVEHPMLIDVKQELIEDEIPIETNVNDFERNPSVSNNSSNCAVDVTTGKLLPLSACSSTVKEEDMLDINDTGINMEPTNYCFTTKSSTRSSLSHSIIKENILSGQFKIYSKIGRSEVWDLFRKVQNEVGEELENLVACKNCLNIYKFNQKSTSNLVKHRCYIMRKIALAKAAQIVDVNDASAADTHKLDLGNAAQKLEQKHESATQKFQLDHTKSAKSLQMYRTSAAQKCDLDMETKKTGVCIVTQWIVENCRPLQILEDDGLRKFAEFLISIGAKYGQDVSAETILPEPTTIARNIENVCNLQTETIKAEISEIKDYGYGLTCDLWSDIYLRTSYLCSTIHYTKNGLLITRLLGISSMSGDECTSANIRDQVHGLLSQFDCELDDRATVVTDRGPKMLGAFRSSNHINCINHLLNDALEKSVEEVSEVAELCRKCTKLVQYFRKLGQTSLSSFSPPRWNIAYHLLDCIQKNWPDIINVLQEREELQTINDINLNHISSVWKILQVFKTTSKKLESSTYATLYITIVHIYRLRKMCVVEEGDLDIIKQFKEKLNALLKSIVLKNLSIYHKIALFLFPPANKLIQFSAVEKQLVKDECKRIMKSYINEVIDQEAEMFPTSGLSPDNIELFQDFVQTVEALDSNDRISNELRIYENTNVVFNDAFDVLQWWEMYQTDLPLMYKLSCKILATPASSAASERIFAAARNLISNKQCLNEFDRSYFNEIMFLHSNINQTDLLNELSKKVIIDN